MLENVVLLVALQFSLPILTITPHMPAGLIPPHALNP